MPLLLLLWTVMHSPLSVCTGRFPGDNLEKSGKIVLIFKAQLRRIPPAGGGPLLGGDVRLSKHESSVLF